MIPRSGSDLLGHGPFLEARGTVVTVLTVETEGKARVYLE
jgi:hypothetical protein